jgi:hypothetical protein
MQSGMQPGMQSGMQQQPGQQWQQQGGVQQQPGQQWQQGGVQSGQQWQQGGVQQTGQWQQGGRNFLEDAESLYTAMKGSGTDEQRLIAIIGNRNRQELYQIDMVYRQKYGKPLADHLADETSGHFRDVLVNVVQTPDLTDAILLHKSMTGLGTSETVVNEIMATRDGEEIDRIKMTYVTVYRSGLEELIKGDASGKWENLLLALLNGPRGKGSPAGFVDQMAVAADTQRLYEAPSEATFTNILGNASHAHIMAVREMFMSKYGKSLNEVISKQFSGNYKDLLIVLVTPREQYFAEVLHKAMKGIGTDKNTIVRVIGTRYGIDLELIKQYYVRTYNKSLFAAVKSETSGNFEKILLELIGSS